MSARFQFIRIRQILKELKEYTDSNENSSPEYVSELREETDELIDQIEKDYGKMSISLIENGKSSQT